MKLQIKRITYSIFQISFFLITGYLTAADADGDGEALRTIQGVWQNQDGYMVRWEDERTGIFHEAFLRIDSVNKNVTEMWEAFIAKPNDQGVSKRMFVTANGGFGHAMQAFDGKDFHLSWTAPGGGSGYHHAKLSNDGLEMHSVKGLAIGPLGFKEQSELKSEPYTRLTSGHEQAWKTIRSMIGDDQLNFPDKPFFEPRFQGLLGKWTGTLPDNGGTVDTLFRRTALGSFMVESFTISQEDGAITNAGINLSGKDTQNGSIISWTGNDAGFSQTGGWDFIDENVTGQRQGNRRFIRHIRADDTIEVHMEEKVNGSYERIEGNITLKKIPDRAKAMETITHFNSSFVDAFNSGDLKRLEGAYHEDAIKAVSRYEMPLVGRESIVQDFSDRTGAEGQTLKAEVVTASFITPKHMLAAGTFVLDDASNNEMRSGKWGNVFLVEKDKCQILQEGAFFSASEKESPTAKRTKLAAPIDPASRHYRGSEKLIELYAKCWQAKDVEALKNVFRHDGIRSVSTVSSVSADHKEIRDTIKEELEGSVGQISHDIEAVTLGSQPLAGAYFMAHGRWQAISKSGEIVRGGLWANVFEMRGEEVKLMMESAGAHQP